MPNLVYLAIKIAEICWLTQKDRQMDLAQSTRFVQNIFHILQYIRPHLSKSIKLYFSSHWTLNSNIIFSWIMQWEQEISALPLCICPAKLQKYQTTLFSSGFHWNPNWPGWTAIEPSEIPQNSLQDTIEMGFSLCVWNRKH